MTSIFSYLITMLGGVFWIVRVAITLAYTMGWNIGIEPLNVTVEVILLFATLICMIFVVKRNIIGALVYFVLYGFYFGNDLYSGVVGLINGNAGATDYLSLFISFMGVLIPFLIVMDIFLNKDGTTSGKNKKTDWYYQTDEYDRKYDDRADKNQYKF